MTTQQRLYSMLTDRGLSDKQVDEVMELAKPEFDKVADQYDITYDRPSDEYPDVIYNILFMLIKPITLKWIEENKPMAWFKVMFI